VVRCGAEQAGRNPLDSGGVGIHSKRMIMLIRTLLGTR